MDIQIKSTLRIYFSAHLCNKLPFIQKYINTDFNNSHFVQYYSFVNISISHFLRFGIILISDK